LKQSIEELALRALLEVDPEDLQAAAYHVYDFGIHSDLVSDARSAVHQLRAIRTVLHAISDNEEYTQTVTSLMDELDPGLPNLGKLSIVQGKR
jgi:hypothetical protein